MKHWTRRFFGVIFLVITLIGSRAHAYAEDSDPDLRAGFPVRTIDAQSSVSLVNGQSNLAVGDIDGDGKQEIVFPTLSWNYVYAIRPDGTIVSGWPVTTGVTPFVALGHILGNPNKLDIFVSTFDESFYGVIDGSGVIQSGWPISVGTDFTFTGPMLIDADGDGHDEIFFNRHDTTEHEFTYLGTELTPASAFVVPHFTLNPYSCGQTLSTPLAIKQGGTVQIVLEGEDTTGGSCVASYNPPGTGGFSSIVTGSGLGTVSPVSAVMSNGGSPSIITTEGVLDPKTNKPGTKVLIFGTSGNIISQFITPASPMIDGNVTEDQSGGVQPILADLDGDGIPEIVMQDADEIYVYRADGSLFPGWPVKFNPPFDGNIGSPVLDDYSPQPAVGDIDGDGQPDIVITYAGYVSAYDRFGRLIPGFPKNLNSNPAINDNCLSPGAGTSVEEGPTDFQNLNPAVADIDGDGFNEIIVGGSRDVCPNTPAAGPLSLFVYDLGGFSGGRIEWGQFRANPERTGVYGGSITNVPDIDIGYKASFSKPVLITGTENTGTATVTNHSAYTASNVTFNMTFPNVNDIAAVSIDEGAFQCLTLRGRYLCRLSSLAPGQTVSLGITAQSAKPGLIAANIQVSHDGYESKLSDNFGTLSINLVALAADAASESLTTSENTPISGRLPGSVPNYSGQLTFRIIEQSFRGLVQLTNASTGSFTYTPGNRETGFDSFSYELSAPNAKPGIGTIKITITPQSTGSSGGGGVMDALTLGLLGLLGGIRCRRFLMFGSSYKVKRWREPSAL